MTETLTIRMRTKLGTRPSRVLRAEGQIPSSLHGEGGSHFDIAIDEHQFLALRRKHEHVFMLPLEEAGGRSAAAIVEELQWDVFGERLLHVEFREVDLKKKTEVEVALVFTGNPKGVLNHLMDLVEVRSLPTDIPDQLEVSIEGFEVGHTIHASDLKLPEGVELVTPGDEAIAAIVDFSSAEPEPVEEPAEGAEGSALADGAPGADSDGGSEDDSAK